MVLFPVRYPNDRHIFEINSSFLLFIKKKKAFEKPSKKLLVAYCKHFFAIYFFRFLRVVFASFGELFIKKGSAKACSMTSSIVET